MANLDFNVEPYYDDFNESKHFHKILFKPGYSVQARELTQLQSIIQYQIDKFGSHVFKDGSVVHDGSHSPLYTTAIAIKSFSGFLTLKEFLNLTVYIGDVKKLIVHTETINSVQYIFVVDKTSGNIQENSTLLVENVETASLLVESSTNTAINTDYILHQIKSGVYFVSGMFVKVEEQTIVVSNDKNTNSDIYLEVKEYIISSIDDESLLDNALGSTNYSAPGSDRYSIDLTLEVTISGESLQTTNKHFLIASYRKGSIVVDVNAPEYSDLEKHLAERTYNESGDYTVIPFIGKVDDDKNNDNNFILKLDSGTAYIKGFEFKTIAQTSLSIPKARTTNFVNNSQVLLDKGPYVVVENLFGLLFPYSTSTTIDIHSVLSTNVSLNTSSSYDVTKIGTATAHYTVTSGVTGTYKLFLTDVKIFSGKSISNAKSFIVKSGSSSFVISFSCDFSSEEYGTKGVSVFNTQNFSQLFRLSNSPVKTHLNSNNVSDISYQCYKEYLNTSFIADGTNSVGVFTLNGNQSFIGIGVLSSSAIAQQWYVTVKTVGTSGYTVGQLVPVSDISVTIFDEVSAEVKINRNSNMTINVFTVISDSISSTRNKQLVSSTYTVLTANISNQIISLQKSDGFRLISVLDDLGGDHTSKYTFYTGQKDSYYDHASIKLNNPNVTPISTNQKITQLTVSFEYYSHTGFGPFTADSYYNVVSYNQIPSFKTTSGEVYRLSDVLDFRPRRTDGASSIVFDSYHRPSFDSYLTTDYEYYIPRSDRVVITPDLKLSILSGVPAKFPLIPDAKDSLTLYIISIPAYTFNSSDVIIEYVDNKRYTMKDIAKIDKRVNRLEYYTTLSLLEKQAADEAIPSEVPGIDKFKNGILVDSFAGHSVGDVYNPDYNCAIEFNNRYLRPAYEAESFGYTVDNFNTTNVIISDNHAFLDYTETAVITQMVASETESAQPFSVFKWNGIMEMDPPTDVWIDTVIRPEATVNMNGNNDAYSVFAQGNGQKWSSWETTGKGITSVSVNPTVTVASQTKIVN